MSEVNPTPASETPLRRIPFSETQISSLRALCNWMQVAAVISIVGGVGKVVSAFSPRQDFSKLIDAVITLLIGYWIYQAGTAFRKVANTDTADQHHLVEGFSLLRRVFLLQSIMVILVLALLVVILTVVLLAVAARSTSGG